MKSSNCVICTSSSVHLIQIVNKFQYIKCNVCGLISYIPVLSKDELSAYYDSDYYSRSQISSNYNKISKLRADILNAIQTFKLGKRLLEIGCGEGHFLNLCREYGLSVEGIEISDFASINAHKNYNIDVHCGTLLDYKQTKPNFDMIVAWNVVEHFQEIRENFEKCHEILNDNGLFLIRTMNIDSTQYLISKFRGQIWKYIDPPFHTFIFSRKTIKLLLQKVGFKEITFINDKVLERLETKNGFNNKKYSRNSFSIKSLSKKIIRFFGYDNHIMYVVARKSQI